MLNYLNQLRSLQDDNDEREVEQEVYDDRSNQDEHEEALTSRINNYASDFSLVPFTEVIPPFWREEILELPDSPLK